MDSDLLQAFWRGDRDGLTRVYRLHIRSVENRVRLVLLRMGLLTKADLADIVQDVFIHAFSEIARRQYDGRREYGPFLLTIARNVVVDWVRRRNREKVPADVLIDFVNDSESADSAASPYEDWLLNLTDAYVTTLSLELRGVHQYRFALSLPQREAAAALGISRQVLRTLEKRLVVGLRRHLRRAEVLAHSGQRGVPATRAGSLPERMASDAGRR